MENQPIANRISLEDGTSRLTQKLIMVDDAPSSLQGFRSMVERMYAGRWQVEILCEGHDLLHSLDDNFPLLPALVSIDLGLPPEPLSPRYGIELLEQIHQSYPGLLLVVHSKIMPIPAWASQFILSIPASYVSIALEEGTLAYAQMLPWIAKGFRFYSPAVSETLSRVVLRHPDPLDDEEWQIVELVTQGLTNYQIATRLNYGVASVGEKIGRIGRRLKSLHYIDVNVDERPTPNRFRDAFATFYQENAVRYGRHRS